MQLLTLWLHAGGALLVERWRSLEWHLWVGSSGYGTQLGDLGSLGTDLRLESPAQWGAARVCAFPLLLSLMMIMTVLGSTLRYNPLWGLDIGWRVGLCSI